MCMCVYVCVPVCICGCVCVYLFCQKLDNSTLHLQSTIDEHRKTEPVLISTLNSSQLIALYVTNLWIQNKILMILGIVYKNIQY